MVGARDLSLYPGFDQSSSRHLVPDANRRVIDHMSVIVVTCVGVLQMIDVADEPDARIKIKRWDKREARVESGVGPSPPWIGRSKVCPGVCLSRANFLRYVGRQLQHDALSISHRMRRP